MWCREGEKHVLSRNLGEKWSSCSREDFAVLCHVPPPSLHHLHLGRLSARSCRWAAPRPASAVQHGATRAPPLPYNMAAPAPPPRPRRQATAIPSGFQSATISMLNGAFPLPLPGPAAPGMAEGRRGLSVPIRPHPRPGGRRGRPGAPGSCGEGRAALLPALGPAAAGPELRGGEAGPSQASAAGLPARARVSRAAASRRRGLPRWPRLPPRPSARGVPAPAAGGLPWGAPKAAGASLGLFSLAPLRKPGTAGVAALVALCWARRRPRSGPRVWPTQFAVRWDGEDGVCFGWKFSALPTKLTLMRKYTAVKALRMF